MTYKDWREDSLCSTYSLITDDPDFWFRPEDTYDSRDAAQMCFECPVRQECLKTACEVEAKEGVWGGQPASVRRKAKHDYDSLVEMLDPYDTANARSPHHHKKLRPYDPEMDDDE